jgi:hypothetical protein
MALPADYKHKIGEDVKAYLGRRSLPGVVDGNCCFTAIIVIKYCLSNNL